MAGGVSRRQGQASSVVNGARQVQETRSTAAAKAVTPEALASMTKEQLKSECRRRGQKASGNKVELLARLGYYKLTAQASPAPAAEPAPAPPDAAHAHKNGEPRASPATKENKFRSGGVMEPESALVLWKRPLTTLEYFGREMLLLCSLAAQRLFAYKAAAVSLLMLCTFTALSYNFSGPHQPYLQLALTTLLWWGWWVLLGVLSSVGLGTGLHTFLLYLGPHIAKVTLAAYECGAVNFPDPPYPNEIICPDSIDPRYAVSIWNIMAKVRIESMMWGLGTALGELPPYFMARAARLSGGGGPLRELDADDRTLTGRAKAGVQRLVERVGFLGILACASIPNPLFDLAGLTCGHFLVPFWTFFGATLLGKAVVKMHIQKMFVIVAFNEVLIGQALTWVERIPYVGPRLEAPLLDFLRNQKQRLHKGEASDGQGSLLANLLEKFVLAMVVYFVVSIVNSLAQSQQRRTAKGGRKSKKQKE